jgi:predicted dehydrogenase
MYEKPTVAVLGCGFWGRNLVRNFAELGVLKAIVDPDRAAAEELAEKFDVPVLEESEVFADESITAIATASPAPLHRDITTRALEAGKHVFVEKPIALTMEDGEAMRDKAVEVDRILMVGHVLQYHPVYQKLRELVRSGAIGKLLYVYSNRMSMGKFRTEEDVVWSFAPHDLSMILGLVEEQPLRIYTHGAMLVSDNKFDTAHLHLEFGNGLKAHVFTSWLSPHKEQKLVAIGETGSLTFDDTVAWVDKLTLTKHSMVDGPALQKGPIETIETEWAEPLKKECLHFLQSVESKIQPISNADEALRVLSALRRAEQVGKSGKST